MTDPISIVVPGVPDRRANPNARCSERTTRRYRSLLGRDAAIAARAVYLAIDPSNSGWVLIPGPAVVDILVRWPRGRRTMDRDNLCAACKGAIDALWREAIIGDDRDLRIGEVAQERAVAQPETILTVRALETGGER